MKNQEEIFLIKIHKKYEKVSIHSCEIFSFFSFFFFFVFSSTFAVSVYYFPTENEEDDEDGPTFKEIMVEKLLRGIDIFCVWDCCWAWLKVQEWIAWLVFDPFVELFITLCIVVNTLFMALDHHNMDRGIEKVLKTGNYVNFN